MENLTEGINESVWKRVLSRQNWKNLATKLTSIVKETIILCVSLNFIVLAHVWLF
jgi:hypothetical protein